MNYPVAMLDVFHMKNFSSPMSCLLPPVLSRNTLSFAYYLEDKVASKNELHMLLCAWSIKKLTFMFPQKSSTESSQAYTTAASEIVKCFIMHNCKFPFTLSSIVKLQLLSKLGNPSQWHSAQLDFFSLLNEIESTLKRNHLVDFLHNLSKTLYLSWMALLQHKILGVGKIANVSPSQERSGLGSDIVELSGHEETSLSKALEDLHKEFLEELNSAQLQIEYTEQVKKVSSGIMNGLNKSMQSLDANGLTVHLCRTFGGASFDALCRLSQDNFEVVLAVFNRVCQRNLFDNQSAWNIITKEAWRTLLLVKYYLFHLHKTSTVELCGVFHSLMLRFVRSPNFPKPGTHVLRGFVRYKNCISGAALVTFCFDNSAYWYFLRQKDSSQNQSEPTRQDCTQFCQRLIDSSLLLAVNTTRFKDSSRSLYRVALFDERLCFVPVTTSIFCKKLKLIAVGRTILLPKYGIFPEHHNDRAQRSNVCSSNAIVKWMLKFGVARTKSDAICLCNEMYRYKLLIFAKRNKHKRFYETKKKLYQFNLGAIYPYDGI